MHKFYDSAAEVSAIWETLSGVLQMEAKPGQSSDLLGLSLKKVNENNSHIYLVNSFGTGFYFENFCYSHFFDIFRGTLSLSLCNSVCISKI